MNVARSSVDVWTVLSGLGVLALVIVVGVEHREGQRLAGRVAALERNAPSDVSTEGVSRVDDEIDIRDAAWKGRPAAKLVMLEFSDFECPYCRRYWRESFSKIDEKYIATGLLSYVFRHYPLEDIHPDAFAAGEAAECARRQGLFWPMHDRLIGNPQMLGAVDLVTHANGIGADIRAFENCIRGSAVERIRKDQEDGRRIGVAGTPVFFVGVPSGPTTVRVQRRVDGAKPFEVFEAVLDELLRSGGT